MFSKLNIATERPTSERRRATADRARLYLSLLRPDAPTLGGLQIIMYLYIPAASLCSISFDRICVAGVYAVFVSVALYSLHATP